MALEIRNIPTLSHDSTIKFLESIESDSNKIPKDRVEIMKKKCYKILENSNIGYGKEN